MDASNEFLNPSSMLTPGLAGGMTMAITNSLCAQFALVAPEPAYLGLGLSFLFGMLVWVNQDVSRIRKAVLYVLNSLVIFVVAVGSNAVGAGAGPATVAAAERLTDMAMSSAVAQTARPEPGWCCADGRVNATTRDQCSRAGGRFDPKEAGARASCERPSAAAAQAPAPQSQGKFFRPWIGAQRP